MDLRSIAERDLANPMRDWGTSIVLCDPDGVVHEVVGQVFANSVRLNPDNGSEVVVYDPRIILRYSTLDRAPISGEVWHVKTSLAPGRPIQNFSIDPSRPIEGGHTIGYLKIYLREVEQS
jgi:hypothetical protein